MLHMPNDLKGSMHANKPIPSFSKISLELTANSLKFHLSKTNDQSHHPIAIKIFHHTVYLYSYLQEMEDSYIYN